MARPLLSLCPLAGLSAGSQACAEAICSLGSLLHKGQKNRKNRQKNSLH